MIEKRPFGRTGHQSTVTLFGAAALAQAGQADADRTLEEVLATCRERNVAVQIIKAIARGPWATTDRTRRWRPCSTRP